MGKSRFARKFDVTSLGTLSALLIAAFTVVALVQAWAAALGHAEQRSQALAQEMADFTYRALDTYDQILVDLTGFVADDAQQPLLEVYLRRQRQHHANLLNLFIFDADGAILAGTQDRPADLSDRNYFTAHRDNENVGRFVGHSDISRITGKWFFPLSRRLDWPDNSFAGVVAATVNLADLTEAFDALRGDQDVSITLVHHDSTVLVRSPDPDESKGRSIPLAPFDGAVARTFIGPSPFDGQTRIVTQRQVSQYPLVVLASLPRSVVLVEWLHRAVPITLVALALMAGVLAFARRLHREAQGRERLMGELAAAKEQAETALSDLNRAQDLMVRNEKLAALGGLVAGVAHEINTPVGNALTGASYLAKETETLGRAFADQTLTASSMKTYLETADEASRLILSNCRRAAELIHGFKQVAVDQTSGERRRFDLAEYVAEILLSLRPKLKHTKHRIDVYMPENVEIDGYPGALSQVITNLVVNSLMHGFDDGRAGFIDLAARVDGDICEIAYSDNGKGIPVALHAQVFEPFFTTRRGSGGSGLGLNIVHNIVHRTLAGTLELQSSAGRGVHFLIRFPLKAPAQAGVSQGNVP